MSAAVGKAIFAHPEPFAGESIHLGARITASAVHLPAQTAQVTLTTFRDAIFDAHSTLLHTRQGVVEDTIYLVPPEIVAHPVGPHPVDLSGHRRLVVGYNRASNNYYHWILQSLPAIFVYAQPGSRKPTVLLPRAWLKDTYHKQSLDLAHLNVTVLPVERRFKYRCKEIEYCNCLRGALDYHPSPPIVPLYDRIRRAALDRRRRSGSRRSPLVYVARTDSANRRLVNEDAIIGLMERYGFAIAHLSDMPVHEQVRLFAEARLVVAPHGAGLTNVVFCNADCTIYELTPEHYVNPCFVNLARTRGLDYWIDAFESLEGGEGHAQEWKAAPDQVAARLDEILRKVDL